MTDTDDAETADEQHAPELEVTTLRSTPKPEELVVQAARGDYYDGFVGDTDYDELVADVEFDEKHREYAAEYLANMEHPADWGFNIRRMARTYALLERLFRRGHWGPYEHPQITLAVRGASRSCMAQVTRHRHATFDVQSQRYVDFGEKEDRFQMPKSLTDPDHATREMGEVELNELDREFYRDHLAEKADELFELYENMVANGVPKEDARFVLPIGTKVNWTMSMNARALLHLANMRAKADAQWEARDLANQVLAEFEEWMPLTAELWDDHGPLQLSP